MDARGRGRNVLKRGENNSVSGDEDKIEFFCGNLMTYHTITVLQAVPQTTSMHDLELNSGAHDVM
jgi:hypothetical protein